MTDDLALLQAVQDGAFWLDQDRVWRHNLMRPVTDQEAALLDQIAVCEPGQTAHLTRDAYNQLDGMSVRVSPGEGGNVPHQHGHPPVTHQLSAKGRH